MLLPAGLLLVGCLALLLLGLRFERKAAKNAKALLEDVKNRMGHVLGEVYRRGDLSNIPPLRYEATKLIQDCNEIAQEDRPIVRDFLIKEKRIASRAKEIEDQLWQWPTVDGE